MCCIHVGSSVQPLCKSGTPRPTTPHTRTLSVKAKHPTLLLLLLLEGASSVHQLAGHKPAQPHTNELAHGLWVLCFELLIATPGELARKRAFSKCDLSHTPCTHMGCSVEGLQASRTGAEQRGWQVASTPIWHGWKKIEWGTSSGQGATPTWLAVPAPENSERRATAKRALQASITRAGLD
jgi:hypothetical protein